MPNIQIPQTVAIVLRPLAIPSPLRSSVTVDLARHPDKP